MVNTLFLAHCTREKGIFAAAEAVLHANRELAARRLPLKLKLVAAGNFVTSGEAVAILTGSGRIPKLPPSSNILASSPAPRKTSCCAKRICSFFPPAISAKTNR